MTRVLILGGTLGESGVLALRGAARALAIRTGADFLVVDLERADDRLIPPPEERIRALRSELGADLILFGAGAHGRVRGAALEREPWLVLPANRPTTTPRDAVRTLTLRDGRRLPVLTLALREGIVTVTGSDLSFTGDCPFRALDEIRSIYPDEPGLLVTYGTSPYETAALAHHGRGWLAAVVGIGCGLRIDPRPAGPGGVPPVCLDCGLTGTDGGVLGFRPETVLARFLTALPAKPAVCERGTLAVSGVLVTLIRDGESTMEPIREEAT